MLCLAAPGQHRSDLLFRSVRAGQILFLQDLLITDTIRTRDAGTDDGCHVFQATVSQRSFFNHPLSDRALTWKSMTAVKAPSHHPVPRKPRGSPETS
jgi:hypothetical protein